LHDFCNGIADFLDVSWHDGMARNVVSRTDIGQFEWRSGHFVDVKDRIHQSLQPRLFCHDHVARVGIVEETCNIAF
jgi:hypothetical protein